MYFSFDIGWYSIHLWYCPLGTGGWGWGWDFAYLNGQNLLSMMKVIC